MKRSILEKNNNSDIMTTTISRLSILRYLPAMFLMMSITINTAHCEEPPKDKQAVSPEVEVSTLKIQPSYDGVGYEGIFGFMHHGREPLKMGCSQGRLNTSFLPNNVQFQVLRNGAWTKVDTFSEGYSMSCDIPPGIPCELHVNLSPFKEQDEPLTGRVVFNWDKYFSEPFTLNWKADRKAGKFLASKKAHAERLRSAFLKSGFRPELLKGDDFPLRFVNGMITSLAKSGEIGKWFGINKGDLNFDAKMMWKGDVSIIFSSVTVPGRYSGVLRWNPERLSRALIRKLRRTDCIADVTLDTESGKPDGFRIIIDPDDPVDPASSELDFAVRPFAMRLFVSLPENDAESLPMPKKGESEKALDSAMDYLEGCLTR